MSAEVAESVRVSLFQQRLLDVPETFDLFLGGGRGGGKDYGTALLILRHVEQYGRRARILYLRQTYQGLADFELICHEIFGLVYDGRARYNGSDNAWRFPNGALLVLGQLDSMAAYSKYQGHSYTLLIVSEAGQYAQPDLLDLMRSNMRGPKEIPLRMIISANPGGPGHFWIAKRYVFRAAPWTPFLEEKSGRTWVYAPSTLRDNEFIDQEQYRQTLQASSPADAELLRAWLDGDWAVARGAYFASVLDEARNAVGPFERVPEFHGRRWETYLAHDFGSTAPSVTYLLAVSPGAAWEGKFYHRGSVVALDELAACRRDSLNQGLGWTAAITGEAIVEFCKRWDVKPEGVADDACFAKTGHASSIADEFGRVGVRFDPAKKADRLSGWQLMRRMLADAGKVDAPGLYVSRACEYFWSTVPYLARDQKRVEDLDSSGPDHGADAMRYGLMRQRRVVTVGPLRL